MSSMYSLDRLFDNVFDHAYSTSYDRTEYYQSSTDGNVTLEIPLPGVTKKDLKINVEQSLLAVEATPSVKSKAAKTFKKSWSLPEDVDTDNINAKLENGILTLTLVRVKPIKKSVSVTIS